MENRFHSKILTSYERREFHRELIESGKLTGIFVCLGENPVVWCQVAPVNLLKRFDTGRGYRNTVQRFRETFRETWIPGSVKTWK